jgi:hypothetical protein
MDVPRHVLEQVFAVVGALADMLDERAGDHRDVYASQMRNMASDIAAALPADLGWEVASRREHRQELERRLTSTPSHD